MKTSTVLLLSGAGSSGKTTLARQLQRVTRAPFLHVQMDTFLEMQPPRCDNHPDTFHWETLQEEGVPRTAFRTGPSGAALMRGFRQSIADLATEGWNVIADDVADAQDVADYRRRLDRHRFIAVKVFAPLGILETRERARGDRMIGLARDQWQRVHVGVDYDFEVDTGSLTVEAAAQEIIGRFDLKPGLKLRSGQPPPHENSLEGGAKIYDKAVLPGRLTGLGEAGECTVLSGEAPVVFSPPFPRQGKNRTNFDVALRARLQPEWLI